MEPSLRSILKNLYEISGLRISIFDLEQNLVASYPDTDSFFCALVHEVSKSACLKDDMRALEKIRKTGQTYIYHCHMGLLEVIAPLYHYGILAGYLIIGQAFDPTPDCREHSKALLQKICPDHAKAEQAVNELPVLSRCQIETYSNIMSICAEYITLKHKYLIPPKSLAEELLTYLITHYQEKITLSQLCRIFYSSKTTLNKIFQAQYHQSIFEKLQEIRLMEACRLLTCTKTPIHLVGESCGFPDANYFSRIFRQTYQCSPSQYRIQHSVSPLNK